MPQFNLSWDNTDVSGNTNNTTQKALYRQKSVGGTWLESGFTPSNPMAKTVNSAISPNLGANVFYEFKIQAICTENGPVDNDNGLVEAIKMSCIVPTVDKTHNSSTISLDLSNTDITKATFTLKRQSDNVVMKGPTTVVRSGNSVSDGASSLGNATNYYWEVVLHAQGSGAEILSSASNQLNGVCGPYTFTTDSPLLCSAPKTLTVSNS